MANLYDKAGLVNIPVGYQDGFLYNIKPEDNTLGFRFNRDSAATRVNEEGLIEQVGYFGPELVQNGDFSQLGPELIVNGDFATDSDWDKLNATISGGKATVNIVGGAFSYVNQNKSFTSGKTYKLTAQVKGLSGSSGKQIRFQDNSSNNGGLTVSNGSITLDESTQNIELQWVANSNSSQLIIARKTSTGDYSFEIDNVSVKQVDPNNYWNLNAGWSIEDNKATYDGSGYNSIIQAISNLNNKKIKVQFDIVDYTSGTIRILPNDRQDGADIRFSGNGTYTQIYTSIDNKIDLQPQLFNGSITNVSIVEVLGDKPRIDYTDSLTSPSFLLEPQSTNLLPYSENFSQWTKSVSSITLEDGYISPDGSNNAYKMTAPSNGAYIHQTITLSNEGTTSIYVKSDKLTGEFYLVTADGGLRAQTVTDEWTRVSVTSTPSSSSFRVWLRLENAGDSIYIWGAQLEALPYATSYIPTAGSTVTRTQETCAGAGNVSTFNSTEGVLYAEMAALADDNTYRYVTINDGTDQNVVAIRFSNTSNQILAFTRISGAFNAVLLTTSYSTVNFNKIAYRYKSGDFSLFINGTKVSSSTSTQTLPANTLNTLSFDNAPFSPMHGKVKSVYAFNEALTDDELQQLTGPEYNSFAALAAAYNYTVI